VPFSDPPLLPKVSSSDNRQLHLSFSHNSNSPSQVDVQDGSVSDAEDDVRLDGCDSSKNNTATSDKHFNKGENSSKENGKEDSQSRATSTSTSVSASTSTSQGNNFARSERWLEDATAKILDPSIMPLGRLTEDDVVSITSLMIAWSRRKSLEAAMTVEQLLKRIVDDLRAGNQDVYVSTKIYTVAIEAWGKSDEAAGAERAQTIHDVMIQTFRETKDPRIKPTSKSYNTLMLAWAKSKNPLAILGAEKILRAMLTESDTESVVRPDSVTFAIILNIYARQSGEEAIIKAETLVNSMSGLQVKKNNSVYSALQDVYVRSGRKDAPEKTMTVLQEMLSAHSEGHVRSRPKIVNYNNVLCAYSRTPSQNSALRAVEMVNRIEAPAEEGGYDIDPDRLTYFFAILTCSRCPNSTFGANIAEPLLERMEIRSKAEAKRREELSIAAHPFISLDIECFNVVLTALSKSRDRNAVDRIFKIISRMEEYADRGQEYLRPNTRSLNTALNALSYRKTKDAAKRAEQTLKRMFELSAEGASSKPDAFSYTAILRCYQGLATSQAAQRGNDVLSRMEELYETNVLDEPPDTYHYTIVCSTWSLSRSKYAPKKCIEILSRMKEKDREGWPRVKPNIRTYNAVLDCLSRSHQATRAEELLYHMLSLARNGDEGARPDPFSFNAVINAFIYSKVRDAGRRSESVLERALEYAEEDGGVMPEIKSFTSILGFYSRQKAMDSPYRARYVLNRLISLFKAGHTHLSPHVSCFINVMECYAAQRHRDAGESSEEILRNMIKLQKHYNAKHLEVNTGVMNCVLNSWAESIGNDEAGARAELILDLMEKKSDAGDTSMVPNHRSYNMAIKAWSKSNGSNKAEKALATLQRAKNRHARKKLVDPPPEYAYSLVIQACAFSRNTDPSVETRAFEIAVDVMNELINDVPAKQIEPSSATYGWFIQVCARLQIPESSKEEDLKRIFSRCCEKGRVNEFALQSIKQASSDTLFSELMTECLETTKFFPSENDNPDLKEMIQLSHLPEYWVAKDYHQGTKKRRKYKSK